jgi:hypothetical protein
MGLHKGAPKFVAPKFRGTDDDVADATRAAAAMNEAKRALAGRVRMKVNAALLRIEQVGKEHKASPLAAHFMAHRYIDQIIDMTDLNRSPEIHALAWDAKGLRWQIESLSPIESVEAALIRLRDEATRISNE